MKFYQETTVWAGPYPNHIYLLSDDKSKMFGYLRNGNLETTVFKKAIRFDVRGRTFRVVPELGEINLGTVKSEQWKFTGSKGDTYIVHKVDNMLKCSCPGFTYRGDCKHVKEVEAK
jgi:hypothetical protein